MYKDQLTNSGEKISFIFSTGLSSERSEGLTEFYNQALKSPKHRAFFANNDPYDLIQNLYNHPNPVKVYKYLTRISFAMYNRAGFNASDEYPRSRRRIITILRVSRTRMSEKTGLSITALERACRTLRNLGLVMSYQQQRNCNCYYLDPFIEKIFLSYSASCRSVPRPRKNLNTPGKELLQTDCTKAQPSYTSCIKDTKNIQQRQDIQNKNTSWTKHSSYFREIRVIEREFVKEKKKKEKQEGKKEEEKDKKIVVELKKQKEKKEIGPKEKAKKQVKKQKAGHRNTEKEKIFKAKTAEKNSKLKLENSKTNVANSQDTNILKSDNKKSDDKIESKISQVGTSSRELEPLPGSSPTDSSSPSSDSPPRARTKLPLSYYKRFAEFYCLDRLLSCEQLMELGNASCSRDKMRFYFADILPRLKTISNMGLDYLCDLSSKFGFEWVLLALVYMDYAIGVKGARVLNLRGYLRTILTRRHEWFFDSYCKHVRDYVDRKRLARIRQEESDRQLAKMRREAREADLQKLVVAHKYNSLSRAQIKDYERRVAQKYADTREYWESNPRMLKNFVGAIIFDDYGMEELCHFAGVSDAFESVDDTSKGAEGTGKLVSETSEAVGGEGCLQRVEGVEDTDVAAATRSMGIPEGVEDV